MGQGDSSIPPGEQSIASLWGGRPAPTIRGEGIFPLSRVAAVAATLQTRFPRGRTSTEGGQKAAGAQGDLDARRELEIGLFR